jgi:outer membrane protein OmpA-like peptidoglycan-associated protein
VKQALVTRYHIASDRLFTNGFGASGSIDTNDTLEGRARNRRVELTRE